MTRLALVVSIVAACGGGDSSSGSGTVSGTIDDGAGAVSFSGECEFFSSDDYVHVAVTDDETGIELIWDPAIVDEPGMYTTSGIVPDITLAVLLRGDLLAAEGTVTFTALDDSHATGTLQVTSSRVTGTASFDCTR